MTMMPKQIEGSGLTQWCPQLSVMGLDGDLMASTDNQFATTPPSRFVPNDNNVQGWDRSMNLFGTLIILQFSKKALKLNSCTPALSVYFDDFENDADISNYEGGWSRKSLEIT